MTTEKKGKDEEGKPSEREVFHISGPQHLTCVDWRSPEHRRSIAASLVQGVYVLERDRQQNRQGTPRAQAPPWWQFFHFQLIQVLIDDADSSIFGAIYVYHHHHHHYYSAAPQHQTAPRFVIAFRGTLPKRETRTRDIQLDIQLFLNGLTRNSRYRTASHAVQHMVFVAADGFYGGGGANVWLAGHSLGSAIALQAGKDMAKTGRYIETYLFNPPFTSAPLEMIKNQALKDGIRLASSVLTAGLSVAAKHMGRSSSSHKQQQQQQHYGGSNDQGGFNGLLGHWVPYLFVNPNDPISAEYIGYFEHREKMEAAGLGGIGRVATQNSVVSLVSGALGWEGEAMHLLPSAYVTKNMLPEDELKVAHGIHQWWKLHPYWQSTFHQFR